MLDRSSMTWLGIEDFFNYYLPGVLWFINILVIVVTFNTSLLDQIIDNLNKANQLILIGFAVFVPYIIGIVTGFVCTIVHNIDKRLLGLPEEYVIDNNKIRRVGKLKFGSSLGEKFAQKVEGLARKKFGKDVSPNSLYQNVHYSLQFSAFPRVQTHVARITNLMNLHEGLISPIFTAAILSFVNAYRLHLAGLTILGISLILTFLGLWSRYHYLRETRSKQVYRYFYLWQTIGQEALKNE